MEETVSYSTQYLYDTLKIGITIPVRLVANDSIAVFEAKLDTGSANCIFERVHGENLGLKQVVSHLPSEDLEKFDEWYEAKRHKKSGKRGKRKTQELRDEDDFKKRRNGLASTVKNI